VSEGKRADGTKGTKIARGVSVTIRDVAREAGVSVATVSMVLNDSGPRFRIAVDTQARVRETARALGYVADRRAQSLRSGLATRTVLVAFIARHVPDAFFVDILHALDAAAAAHGRDTQFHLVRTGEPKSWEALHAAAKACAGTIVVGSPPPAELAALRAFPVPVVQIGAGEASTDGAGRAVVRVDNHAAGQSVAAHLLELGHRRIAIIGPKERNWYAPFIERRAGIEASLAEAGASTPWVVFATEPDVVTVNQLRAQGATAAVCLYDRLALRFMREARLAGISIPDALSVASFDDMEWSTLLSPSLTSVRIPRREMAEAAVQTLEALLNGGTPGITTLKPDLMARESTAPLPA
jgi:DNA-binding LacI/PurR family transcriptional regulator